MQLAFLEIMPRIVSFLPAATEIAHALGAGDDLVGRSHECDFPAEVRRLPIVSRPALSLDGLTQSEIDDAVTARMRTGESLYVVDERLLNDLAPDVVLTQDLCQVCAPSGNELTRALASMPSRPSVVYLTPRTLAEIDENILAVGDAIGRASEARALVDRNRARLDRLRDAGRRVVRRPRVSFLEWTDPLFCAGHWVPEMIEIAGGVDRLGRPGGDSVRISWDDVARGTRRSSSSPRAASDCWKRNGWLASFRRFPARASCLSMQMPISRDRVRATSMESSCFLAFSSRTRHSIPTPARCRNSAAPSALSSTHRLYTPRTGAEREPKKLE